MTTNQERLAAEMIDTAIDVIHDGGWTQGRFGSEYYRDVPHCALGALSAARMEMIARDEPKERRAVLYRAAEEAKSAIRRAIFEREGVVYPISMFNDNIAKHADDIVHVMKRASEILR